MIIMGGPFYYMGGPFCYQILCLDMSLNEDR